MSEKTLVLTGDENLPDMPMTQAQVNHLRQLLAWMRCEYFLDEDMQRGFISGAASSVQEGVATPEKVSEVVQQQAAKVASVPLYVRQAHKMLSKALSKHDTKSGIVDEK